MPIRRVDQGDCVYAIAAESKVHWETIWTAPENSELRRRRKVPGVLYPGDEVFVPTPAPRVESVATDQVNRFRVRETVARLRVRFASGDDPWADEPYVLEFGRSTRIGRLDAEGLLDVLIPAGLTEAIIRIDDRDPIALRVGSLDPPDTRTGVAGRLRNLGWLGDPGGDGPSYEVGAAIAAFQARHGLTVTGQMDDVTAERLVDAHGS